MSYSLRTKLSLSYLLVALVLVALISLLTNVFLETQFKNYVIKQQEANNKEVVNSLGQLYQGPGLWDQVGIGNVGTNALGKGMIVKVRDKSGEMIWDATVHNAGLCNSMINQMATNMLSRYPDFEGGYLESNYPITANNVQVGSVEIGIYGPYYLSDNELTFLNTLNKMLLGVALFSMLLALVIGAFMAKRIATPISRVIATAQQISQGYFKDRIVEESNTTEIGQLTSTINNLAETLETQENLRKRLTADVAHELRTPLATLQSHMEAMIDGIWQPDNERLTGCHEEIMRISRMVGDLEQLARHERDNLQLHKTSFDLTQLTQQILQNFEPDFRQKGIGTSFRGDQTELKADRDKVSQVIINLVANALKYTSSGGLVEICVLVNAQQVELTVQDNGSGIAEEDLPYIFERFYRADKSRNRLTGGSGIGLAIVKAIIEAHQGDIRVESKLGQGTEFIVSFPRSS